MNKDLIEKFKVQLTELELELRAREDASNEATKTVELDQSAVGRVSRIDALSQQQMALETERRRKHQLQLIEGAFKRIENEEFGDCYICGEEISLPRLSLNPLLTRCLKCADE